MRPTSLRSADAAGLVVAASVAAIDPSGWYAFVVIKWSAVAIAVAIALWARLRDPLATRLPTRVEVLFGALLIVLATAAIVGNDPLYAWIGTPERHLGVVTWIGFAASVVIGGALNTRSARTRFARWVAAATIFAGLYGVAELVGHSPLVLQTGTDRVGGPYGSASLFGAALCLLVPVSFAAALNDAESRVWRGVAWAAGFFGTLAVVATGTRAAWVGLCASLLIAASATLRRRRRRPDRAPNTRLLATAAVAIGAIAIGAIAVTNSDADVTGRTAGSSSRIAEWTVGIHVVAAHPLLGVGPEGYRTSLADGVSANYERTYGRQVLPDRAHNALIDVGAAGGVFAASLYGAIVGFVVAAGWLVVRRATGTGPTATLSETADRSRTGPGYGEVENAAEDGGQDSAPVDAVLVGFAVAATAYLAQQWFLFPVATIDPILWMVAGSLLVAVWGRRAEPSKRTTGGDRQLPKWSQVSFVIVIAVLGVNAVFATAADRAARVAVEQGDLAAARRAVQLRPDVVRYRLLESQLEPSSVAGRRAAIDDLAHALDVSPRDPIIAQAHAGALLKLAIATGDQRDIDAARTTIRRLVEDDPNCYRCALMLGYAAALANEPGEAKTAFARAAALARSGDLEAQSNLDQLDRMETPSTPSP